MQIWSRSFSSGTRIWCQTATQTIFKDAEVHVVQQLRERMLHHLTLHLSHHYFPLPHLLLQIQIQ